MNYQESELAPLDKETADKMAEIFSVNEKRSVESWKQLKEFKESFDCSDEETRNFLEDFIERNVTHKAEGDKE